MANYKLVNADQLDTDLTNLSNAIKTQAGISTSTKLHFSDEMITTVQSIAGGEAQYTLSGTWQFAKEFTSRALTTEKQFTESFKFYGNFYGVDYKGVDAIFTYQWGEDSVQRYSITIEDNTSVFCTVIESTVTSIGYNWSAFSNRTIGFGSEPQIISKNFYKWLIANATLGIHDNGKQINYKTDWEDWEHFPFWISSQVAEGSYLYTVNSLENTDLPSYETYFIFSITNAYFRYAPTSELIPIIDPTDGNTLTFLEDYNKTFTYPLSSGGICTVTCNWQKNISLAVHLTSSDVGAEHAFFDAMDYAQFKYTTIDSIHKDLQS